MCIRDRTGSDGQWCVRLKPMQAGGPHTLAVAAGKTRLHFSNVLVGEVWLCSCLLYTSKDGGKTWEKMRLPLAFGEYGGLPAAQNGVGDPSILVDTKTNTIWIVAAWTHGMGNQRAWVSSHPGMDMNHTAQLMMTKSTEMCIRDSVRTHPRIPIFRCIFSRQ